MQGRADTVAPMPRRGYIPFARLPARRRKDTQA